MKKYLIIIAAVLVLLALSTSLAFADTYSLPNPSPVWAKTYYANSWSTYVYWDLTNDPILPTNAILDGMWVDWTISPGYGYSGMHLYVYDSTGTAASVSYSGAFIDTFKGQNPRQIFKSRFYVDQWSYPGQVLEVAPKITIQYHTP